MSKHQHSAVTKEIQDLLLEVKTTPVELWDQEYGLEAESDGSVYDLVDHKTYKTLLDWVKMMIEAEHAPVALGMENTKGRFDDEY